MKESDQQAILELTEQLLEFDPETADGPEAVMEELRRVLNFHDWKYYVQSDPVITDYDYDRLFTKLKVLEDANPSLVSADSPTQRVARGLNNDFPTVQHLLPMMSLENSYNADDLRDFDRKVGEALPSGEKVRYTVEPKYDGSSIAVVYENDLMVRAATRGNGTEGDEITNNARTIRTLPLSAPFSRHGIRRVEVRGEVLIELEAFRKLNEERIEQNRILREQGKKELELFKHARNTAAGALRLKDPKDVAARNLEAVIYQVGYAEDAEGREITGEKLASHFENMEMLAGLGFKSPSGEKGRFDTIDEVIAFCEQWEAKRDAYHYEIDGMVIKVDDRHHQRLIGGTSHHPKWAIAFKFKAKQAITRLLHIDYQVGRTGAVTPVAKLEPVILTGVEISSVSLHNEDFISDKDIRINDYVVVERAGDVIPYIVGPVQQRRDGGEQVVDFPRQCPSCSEKLVKPLEESVWRCINPDCPAQLEERMIHFVSKGAMNIDGLGRDIIKRFIQEGILNSLEDIYNLDYGRILALEGWKERSVEKLRGSIEASRANDNWRLLVGLGVRHVGGTTAKMLVKQVGSLLDFSGWTEKQLVELEDVGPKVAASIHEFFSDAHNVDIVRELAGLGVNISSRKEVLKSNALEGKTFLFTGTLSKFSRDQAKAMVDENGGKNLSGVSAKLDYLVAGEKAGSKLKKAEALGTVNIISEDDFLDMIG
jgi:DNA ligase (NAD+)